MRERFGQAARPEREAALREEFSTGRDADAAAENVRRRALRQTFGAGQEQNQDPKTAERAAPLRAEFSQESEVIRPPSNVTCTGLPITDGKPGRTSVESSMAGANSVVFGDPASATKSYTKPTVYVAPAVPLTCSDEFFRLGASRFSRRPTPRPVFSPSLLYSSPRVGTPVDMGSEKDIACSPSTTTSGSRQSHRARTTFSLRPVRPGARGARSRGVLLEFLKP